MKHNIVSIIKVYNISESEMQEIKKLEVIELESNNGEWYIEQEPEVSDFEWMIKMYKIHHIPIQSLDIVYYLYEKQRRLQQAMNEKLMG